MIQDLFIPTHTLRHNLYINVEFKNLLLHMCHLNKCRKNKKKQDQETDVKSTPKVLLIDPLNRGEKDKPKLEYHYSKFFEEVSRVSSFKQFD